MDPRLETDTSGPGEDVFDIRFNGKPWFVTEQIKFQNPKKNIENIKQNPIRTLLGDELEMSSVYDFLFFGHILAPWRGFCMIFGGNDPLGLPDLSKLSRIKKNLGIFYEILRLS